jgi:hypothetical protein
MIGTPGRRATIEGVFVAQGKVFKTQRIVDLLVG